MQCASPELSRKYLRHVIFKDITGSSVKLEFLANQIRVIDPKESAKDRAEVQKTMESEILRVTEFPRLTFESTSVERHVERAGAPQPAATHLQFARFRMASNEAAASWTT
jgi:hypothetical protein